MTVEEVQQQCVPSILPQSGFLAPWFSLLSTQILVFFFHAIRVEFSVFHFQGFNDFKQSSLAQIEREYL